ncbi:MAG TPA: hypothetical protein VEO20_00870 [Thermoplasmata archaeon]|nr:hypothetical protein [Thermoplasmata archaeon]
MDTELPPKGLREWLAFADSPARAAADYRLFFGEIFALACGLFLSVEILAFGVVTANGPTWGLPFVAALFLFLGAITTLGGFLGIRAYSRRR